MIDFEINGLKIGSVHSTLDNRITYKDLMELPKEKLLDVGRTIIVNGKEFTVKSENRTKDGWLEYVVEEIKE